MKGWTSIKDTRDNECCENQPRFAIMSEDDEERRLKSVEERRKCDKRKRKEKRKREKDDLKSFTKLMGLSAAGKTKKLRKMLEKDAYLDLYTFDPEGHTALHKVLSVQKQFCSAIQSSRTLCLLLSQNVMFKVLVPAGRQLWTRGHSRTFAQVCLRSG